METQDFIFDEIESLLEFKYFFYIDDIWAYNKFSKNYELPRKGFKIHISSTLCNYKTIFSKVIPYLLSNKVKFKIVKNIQELINLNSGIYGYTQIGKTITIYPENKIQLNFLIEKLYKITKFETSINIYSDFRYKNSSVVFYRYGDINNISITDKRIKRLPIRIKVPIEDYYIPRYENLPSKYIVLEILSLRGKSKVYKAIDKERGIIVIIKEGVYCGEYSYNGIDGFDRVYSEICILKKLALRYNLPKIIEYFYINNNIVLVEEFLNGLTLYEFIRKNKIERKYKYFIKILEIIIKIHKKGYILCDISPNNIIVKNDEVNIIDVESFILKSEMTELDSRVGTPGFWTDEYFDENKDLYSFLSLIYGLDNNFKNIEELSGNLRLKVKKRMNLNKLLNIEERDFFNLKYNEKIKIIKKIIRKI